MTPSQQQMDEVHKTTRLHAKIGLVLAVAVFLIGLRLIVFMQSTENWKAKVEQRLAK